MGYWDRGGVEITAQDAKAAGYGTKKPSAVKGRKKCTVCGQMPKSMTEHWQGLAGEQFQAHGPISSNNPNAMKNFPGLKKISEDLGGLFNNRRSW
jgi:hypothetical protein